MLVASRCGPSGHGGPAGLNALLLSDSKTIIETHCSHQRETTISLSDACAPLAAINEYYVLSLAILASHL